jgi:hypothetical protein
MLFWTHIFDLLAKLAAMVIMFAIILLLDGIVPKDQFLVVLVVTMGAGFGAWWFLLRPLSSVAYARVRLDTDLSFAQARRASVLFSPIRNLTTWHPMRHVATLDESERAQAVLSATDALLAHHDARARQWRAAPAGARVLRVLLFVGLGWIAIGVLCDWPPFTLLSSAQARLMDGKYFPILSILVCSIPLGVAFRWLEKRYGIVQVEPNFQMAEEVVPGPRSLSPLTPQSLRPRHEAGAPPSRAKALEDAQRVPVFTKNGESYARVRFGEEKGGASANPDGTCRDCGARIGQYHSLRCELETCPLCDGQARYCNHNWNAG